MGETTPGSQWKVKTELLKRLRETFAEHNIVLPLAPLGSREKKVKTPKKK